MANNSGVTIPKGSYIMDDILYGPNGIIIGPYNGSYIMDDILYRSNGMIIKPTVSNKNREKYPVKKAAAANDSFRLLNNGSGHFVENKNVVVSNNPSYIMSGLLYSNKHNLLGPATNNDLKKYPTKEPAAKLPAGNTPSGIVIDPTTGQIKKPANVGGRKKKRSVKKVTKVKKATKGKVHVGPRGGKYVIRKGRKVYL